MSLTSKKSRHGLFWVSVGLLLLGLAMIIFPTQIRSLACYVIGGGFILAGIVLTVVYLAVEEKRKTDMFGLAKGILPIIFGSVIIMRADQFSSLVIFLFGMAILGDALYNLPVALLIKKNGFSAWWITLIGAILGAAAGLFVIFFPGLSANTVVVLIGAFLVWDSLLNFATNILSTKFLKEKNND